MRETGWKEFRPLSATAPVLVHLQSTPSAPTGDTVSNDYRLQIPAVISDSYTATLTYLAIAQ